MLHSDRKEKSEELLFTTAVSISIDPEQLLPVFLAIYTAPTPQYRLITVKSMKYSKFM